MSALAAHWKATAVTVGAVAVDAQDALHVHLDLTAKITFDRKLQTLDDLRDESDLLIGELTGTRVRINVRRSKNLAANGKTDAVNIRQRVFDLFVVGDFDSEQAGHKTWFVR